MCRDCSPIDIGNISRPVTAPQTPPATPTPEGLAAAWGLLTTPDGCRLATMEVYDLARAAVDEASGGAFSDYQGGDTVRAAVARLAALATATGHATATAGEGAS